MKNENKSNDTRRRVVALLNRREIEFLDQLALDAQFSTGSKLTRVEVIASLIDISGAMSPKLPQSYC